MCVKYLPVLMVVLIGAGCSRNPGQQTAGTTGRDQSSASASASASASGGAPPAVSARIPGDRPSPVEAPRALRKPPAQGGATGVEADQAPGVVIPASTR